MNSNKISLIDLKKIHVSHPYDVIVDVYQQKHFDEKIFDPILEKFAQQLPFNATVLDAGCGPGGETKKLLAQGFTVKSIDISEGMLNKARNLVPNGEFMQMDIMDLQFPASTFDGIWSARTLIHIPSNHLLEVLASLKNVLKSSGLMCLTVLGGNSEGIEPEYYDASGQTSTFFKYFCDGELEGLLKDAGLKVLDTIETYLGDEKEPHISVFAKKV